MENVNTLGLRQNGRHFPDGTFKCIFMNKNVRISINISLKFVPKVQIDNIPALVQIMAWRPPSDKPLSEPMMVKLLTHICVTRPQWVNRLLLPLIHYWFIHQNAFVIKTRLCHWIYYQNFASFEPSYIYPLKCFLHQNKLYIYPLKCFLHQIKLYIS